MSPDQLIEQKKIIHLSLVISNVLSIKMENPVFWILLTTRSISTGHTTFVIFMHLIRLMLILLNTLGSFPICWKKLRISFDVG